MAAQKERLAFQIALIAGLTPGFLNVAADAAGEIIGESVAAGVDKTIMLGIAANETFFGTAPSNLQPYMDPKSNPLQLNSGQFHDGTNPIAGNLEHNVRNAIRLFKNDKAPGRTLQGSVSAYGPPPSQDRHYLADTMSNINEARRGINTTQKISKPFVIR